MKTRALFGLLLLVEDALGHSIARSPVGLVSGVDGLSIDTPSGRVHAHSRFSLQFLLDEVPVRLTLHPNDDIVGGDTTVETLGADGELVDRQVVARHEVRVFRGEAWKRWGDEWRMSGYARIMVHADGLRPQLEGTFSMDHDTHHIQTRDSYLRTKHRLDPAIDDLGTDMVLWRDSDVGLGMGQMPLLARQDQETMCGTEDFYAAPPRWAAKRQIDSGTLGNGIGAGVNLASTIGNTAGCPSKKMVALLGVATDCTYTNAFANQAAVRANIINQYNSASALYERTFNISIGLKSLVISDGNCPGTPVDSAKWNQACSSSVGIDNRLTLFSAWRGAGARQSDGLALWQLLTTCNTGASVGLAWLGMLCEDGSQTQGAQTVSGTSVVARTASEWKVMAHEIGHNFGAVHDCTAQTCANANITSSSQCCPLTASTCDAQSQYIMNPSTMEKTDNFSPCTIGNICSALGRRTVNSQCLTTNRDVTLITANECGNGIVESGEDCDCGGVQGCVGDACCDPKTCKFINSAVCDDANDDCCKGCKFAAANTTCRASTGPCDPAEVCTGSSAACPKDIVSDNGTPCGGVSGLACASGQCTSRDKQCAALINGTSQACDDTSCQLACIHPDYGPTVCFQMQQNLLDGTPCRGSGKCKSGSCVGGDALSEVKNWIDQNKPIVIGVASALGGLLLLAIVSCIWSRCRRAQRKVVPAPGRMAPPTSYAYPRPPPIYRPTPTHPYTGQSFRYG